MELERLAWAALAVFAVAFALYLDVKREGWPWNR